MCWHGGTCHTSAVLLLSLLLSHAVITIIKVIIIIKKKQQHIPVGKREKIEDEMIPRFSSELV